MRFCVISSGSKANCTFVEANGFRLLIDCGLSARQAALRLAEHGIDADSISAILITHEHSDHICGVPAFSRRHKAPVFSSKATKEFLRGCYGYETIEGGEQLEVNSAKIEPFSIVHDAVDPLAFRIRAEGLSFVQVTDLGRVTTLVREKLIGANAVVLESNHDQELLQSCSYSWPLKQRIASTHGHLCNDAAGQLLADIVHPGLEHLVLGHISEQSNRPDLALACAHRYLESTPPGLANIKTMICGSVYKSTQMIDLSEVEGRVSSDKMAVSSC